MNRIELPVVNCYALYDNDLYVIVDRRDLHLGLVHVQTFWGKHFKISTLQDDGTSIGSSTVYDLGRFICNLERPGAFNQEWMQVYHALVNRAVLRRTLGCEPEVRWTKLLDKHTLKYYGKPSPWYVFWFEEYDFCILNSDEGIADTILEAMEDGNVNIQYRDSEFLVVKY